MQMMDYLTQKFLEKRITTVYISNLPISIRNESKTFPAPGKWAKLLIGPTVPIPGPIPAIQVATELKDVFPSRPMAINNMLPVRKINK